MNDAPSHRIGLAYEATLGSGARKRGAHYTPAPVARELVELALRWWERGRGGAGRARDRRPPRFCDPSCGGGAFLLAAADALVARGVDPAVVPGLLTGLDTDPGALDASLASVRAWSAEHGSVEPDGTGGGAPTLLAGDALAVPWSRGGFDLIVGNPPFQGQLRRGTARSAAERASLRGRFGDAAKGYVDSAALFLLAGCDELAVGGVMCLLQPRPTAVATHAAAVRAHVAEVGVVDTWWTNRQVFDAAVDVWAPVVMRDPPDVALVSALRAPGGWADHVADSVGLPPLGEVPGTPIGSLAAVTAGFRDQFYGVIPHASEEADAPDAVARLATVGSLDPLRCTWGRTPVTFASRQWERPVVTAAALDDPVVGRWVGSQLVAKVLVATQTRVIEAFADHDGSYLGVTPTISVVTDPELVGPIAVALCGPVLSLLARRRHGGGGLGGSLRLSAAAVRGLPLPVDPEPWRRAVELASEASVGSGRVPWAAIGERLCAAHRVDDPAVLEWWLAELAGHRRERV